MNKAIRVMGIDCSTDVKKTGLSSFEKAPNLASNISISFYLRALRS